MGQLCSTPEVGEFKGEPCRPCDSTGEEESQTSSPQKALTGSHAVSAEVAVRPSPHAPAGKQGQVPEQKQPRQPHESRTTPVIMDRPVQKQEPQSAPVVDKVSPASPPQRPAQQHVKAAADAKPEASCAVPTANAVAAPQAKPAAAALPPPAAATSATAATTTATASKASTGTAKPADSHKQEGTAASLAGSDRASPAAAAAAPTSRAPIICPVQYPAAHAKLRTDRTFRDVYKLGKTLGTGGFAVVKLAVERSTGQQYACKIMTLPAPGAQLNPNENTREDIFKEINILCGVDHPNVIHLKEYFEEGDKVLLLTELLTGGELLDAVLKRGTYSEAEARVCFSQVLKGIEYLHSRNVVHRDLKLENLLLATPHDISNVKIADFGLAKKAEAKMHTICGTPQYVAPEVIMGTPGLEYGPGVDIWSAGVVLFILLGGYPPFWNESEAVLFDQIRKGQFSFDDVVWDNVSTSAKDLIKQLLCVNPNKRPIATQALGHPWLLEDVPSLPLAATQVNMRRHPRKKFKGAVETLIAVSRMERLTRLDSDHKPELKTGEGIKKAHEAAERYEAYSNSNNTMGHV